MRQWFCLIKAWPLFGQASRLSLGMIVWAWSGTTWVQAEKEKTKTYQCKKCDAFAKAVPPARPPAESCPKGGKCNFQPYVRSSACSPCW